MKCRNLFSWKIRKNVSNLSSAELARRVVKVNLYTLLSFDTTFTRLSLIIIFLHEQVLTFPLVVPEIKLQN